MEANGQDLLARRDVVTDRQFRLLRDRNVVEPGQYFFRCCTTVAAARSLKLIRIPAGAKRTIHGFALLKRQNPPSGSD